MVGKLRAAMDAKQALDPDFVIMARCDLGGVPGASLCGDYCERYIVPTDTPALAATRVVVKRPAPSLSKT
jgi:hypothetical protein